MATVYDEEPRDFADCAVKIAAVDLDLRDLEHKLECYHNGTCPASDETWFARAMKARGHLRKRHNALKNARRIMQAQHEASCRQEKARVAAEKAARHTAFLAEGAMRRQARIASATQAADTKAAAKLKAVLGFIRQRHPEEWAEVCGIMDDAQQSEPPPTQEPT